MALMLFSPTTQPPSLRDEFRPRAIHQYAEGRRPDFYWRETTRFITHGPQQQKRRSEVSQA